MTDDKVVILSEVKKKILNEIENESQYYDRLAFLRKSKEIIGFIKATYDGFAPVLDSQLVERMDIKDYNAMYRMLAKSAIHGIEFTSKMKNMLHIEVQPPPVKEHTEQVQKKEPSVIPERKHDKKEEPWVI